MEKISRAEKLGKKLLTKYTKRITDEIFLFLQNDSHLLKEYREAVQESSQHGVNSAIGKMITEAYQLDNLGIEARPDCSLLKQYTKHKVPNRKEKLPATTVPEIYIGSDLFAQAGKKSKVKKGHKGRERKPKVVEKGLF